VEPGVCRTATSISSVNVMAIVNDRPTSELIIPHCLLHAPALLLLGDGVSGCDVDN